MSDLSRAVRRSLALATTLGILACTAFLDGSGFTGTVATIAAVLETVPIPSVDDAADDPAIWLNPRDPHASRVLGTDKHSGVYVYDLDGALVDALEVGPINNVDVRTTDRGTIAIASHRDRDAVSVFTISSATAEARFVGEFPTGQIEPYGICIGAYDDVFLPVVTYRNGTVQIFEMRIVESPDAELEPLAQPFAIAAEATRTLGFGDQLEGCVVDETHRRLFIGEEGLGVWVVDLANPATAPALVANVTDGSGLVADIEGLALWRGADGAGWLVASAQGADRFVVFERNPPYVPRGVFEVGHSLGRGAPEVDAVSDTDGIDIVAAYVGARYPRGLLVVQDGHNTRPRANQNFKFVDWREVEEALDLPVLPVE